MTPTTTIETESKSHYQRVWNLLSEYKQKSFIAVISHGKQKTYTGIEVFASALSIEEKAQHIRDLLAGMGYMVTADKNNETITIK